MKVEVIRALERTLAKEGEGTLRPASAKWLRRAKEFGLPTELIEFYKDHEPSFRRVGYVELGFRNPEQYQRRLWGIARTLEASGDPVNGHTQTLFQYGYTAFAETLSGDVYCIDSTSRKEHIYPVVLFFFDDIFDPKKQTRSAVRKLRLEVASSLEDFLAKFTAGTLTDEPPALAQVGKQSGNRKSTGHPVNLS
jgi:hypothetical protein